MDDIVVVCNLAVFNRLRAGNLIQPSPQSFGSSLYGVRIVIRDWSMQDLLVLNTFNLEGHLISEGMLTYPRGEEFFVRIAREVSCLRHRQSPISEPPSREEIHRVIDRFATSEAISNTTASGSSGTLTEGNLIEAFESASRSETRMALEEAIERTQETSRRRTSRTSTRLPF